MSETTLEVRVDGVVMSTAAMSGGIERLPILLRAMADRVETDTMRGAQAAPRKPHTPPTANPHQSGVQTPDATQGALEARLRGIEARLEELEASAHGQRG